MVNKRHIVVSQLNFKMLTEECLKEFLEHNPEFIGMRITNDFLITKLIGFYLENRRKF